MVAPPLHRRLAVRLGAAGAILALLGAAAVVAGVLRPVDRFARGQVAEEVRELARDVAAICDDAYSRQLLGGADAGSPAARVLRARTIARVEDYLRREGAGAFLHEGGRTSRLGVARVLPAAGELDAVPRDGEVTRIDGAGGGHYAVVVAFQPWEWEFVVVQDAAAYASVLGSVRRRVGAAAAALVALALLLVALLDRQVQRPVRRLVAALRGGGDPPPSAIAEFDFIAGELRRFREETAARERALSAEVEERRRAEVSLRSREAQLRTVIDNLPFDFFALDREGRYFLQNARSREAFGDVTGRRLEELDLQHALRERWAETNRRALAGETVESEWSAVIGGRERHRADLVVPILVEGRVEGILGYSVDVTERKRLEEERARLNRIESLGVLAGGIAHDFNNLLAAILGNVHLARLESREPETVDLLLQAERACRRSEGLTRQLLTFSRGGAPVRRPVRLGPLLTDTAQMTVRGTAIEARVEVAPDLAPVEGDEGQLAQAFGNLLINAVQSMPGGGRVSVVAENCSPEGAPGSPPGGFVAVEVADSGGGIPPEIIPRIFDPYFTTREAGSGLGLAITFSIVRGHGGEIDVTSAPGRGTTFRVLLPAAVAPEERPAPAAPGPARRARLLVMDDEEAVLAVVLRMLARLGYRADGVRSGEEVLERFRVARAEGDPYEAVILDLTVRDGMGGRETLARLRDEEPEVRAVVASGYSADDVMAHPGAHGFRGVIAKPFESEGLARVLAEVLGGGPA